MCIYVFCTVDNIMHIIMQDSPQMLPVYLL